MSQSNEDIISKAIGIPKIDDLGKYLGTPNISKRVTKATFQYIIDRVDKRLTDWRTKCLTSTTYHSYQVHPHYHSHLHDANLSTTTNSLR